MKQTCYLIAVSVRVPREGLPADDWLTRTYGKGSVAWNVAKRLARHYGEAATITVIRVA